MKIRGKFGYGPEYEIEDDGNGVIAAALRSGEPYEAKLLYHIYRQGFEGTAVDAGAHIGNHTLWFALACGLRVCAFEPIEYKRLSNNLDLNEEALDGSVRHWPVALGEKFLKASQVDKGAIREDPDGVIAVVPLDSLFLEEVSIMKIDVEGWEYRVLRGAAKTIERCHPTIYAEAQDRDSAFRNQMVFTELGYKRTGHVFGATPMEEWIPCPN